MANTYVPSGQIQISPSFMNTVTGDETGALRPDISAYTLAFGATASLPATAQISGYLSGNPICAAGDWLLAHASDPFQGMGDATYSAGLVLASKKVKMLIVYNQDLTNSISLEPKTGNPLLFLAAAADKVTIQPGGILVLTIPTGTAALVALTNDGITVSVSGGTPQAEVLVVYGT